MKTEIHIHLDSLTKKVVIKNPSSKNNLDDAEKLFMDLFTRLLTSTIPVPDETQTGNQYPFGNKDLKNWTLVVLPAEKPVPNDSNEKQKKLLTILRNQIQVTERLVRVLNPTTSKRFKIRNTELVDSLLYQTENLIYILSAFLLPHLEQTDNNKK